MRFEMVFLYLYDVGRSIDLDEAELAFRGKAASRGNLPQGRRLDTPDSLLLPTPLVLPLSENRTHPVSEEVFTSVRFRAKLYAEGVITIECRAEADVPLESLHTLRFAEAKDDEGRASLDELAGRHCQRLLSLLGRSVKQDLYRFDPANREDYHIFCLLEEVVDPQQFLLDHRHYLAPFLLGEDPTVKLHPGQISSTLKTPFSFTDQDVAIFDMDRAFLIAPRRDYEDVILIVEHANFQLLELRTLDKLLDRLLDDAERQVRGHRRKGPQALKLGNLQPVRIEALFLLENLENSSRIIGDYYLEQIYDHLCGIFNTRGWKRNVERRLEILHSIYTVTRTERTDTTMVLLEFLVVVMIGLELVALIVPLFH